MHCSKVVMSCKSLDERVMISILTLKSARICLEGLCTFIAALSAAMSGLTKIYVFVLPANLTGCAMIVVRSGDDSTVNIEDQICIYGAVVWDASDPAIGLHGGMRLPL